MIPNWMLATESETSISTRDRWNWLYRRRKTKHFPDIAYPTDKSIIEPNLMSKSVNIYRNHVRSYNVQREKAKYGVMMVIHMMRSPYLNQLWITIIWFLSSWIIHCIDRQKVWNVSSGLFSLLLALFVFVLTFLQDRKMMKTEFVTIVLSNT